MDIIASKAIELIPCLRYPNFAEILEEAANDLAVGNAQFLLRMEIKRLCSKSVRIIDFRNDGDAQVFAYKGITHFLQKEDLEDFKKSIELYEGIYTVGTYEEVVRNHNERKRIKNEEPTTISNLNVPSRYNIEKIKFTNFANRRDERIFYSSPIVITLPNGEILDAKTSDLSCGGVKVLLSSIYPFKKGELIKITFTGLISLIPNASETLSNIPYESMGTESKDTRMWLKTRCILKEATEFEDIIVQFITANKYRYRIDIDYKAYTLGIQAMEYQYIPKIGNIPLFFSKDDNPELMYALKSDFNHEILDYWRDERSDDKLRSIFSEKRLNSFINSIDSETGIFSTIIYSFKHTANSKTYFLSATKEELQELGLTTTFLKMAKDRDSFRVFKFSISKLNLDNRAIGNLIAIVKDSENKEEITENLSNIGYIASLSRIDVSYDKGIYAQNVSNQSANALQVFTNQTDNCVPVKLEYLQYITPRTEQRFTFQTSISVSSDTFEAVMGWTRDISTRGLQVELSEPVKCYNGDVVYISIPKFSSMRKTLSFNNIPYDVIYINSAHTILHVRLHINPYTNPLARFMDEFIKANPTLPEVNNIDEPLSDMSKVLRTITITNLFSAPVIFIKGFVNRLGYLCETTNTTEVSPLFNIFKATERNQGNLYPIFSNGILTNKILEIIPKLKMINRSEQINVFIKREINALGEISYTPKLEDQFGDIIDLINFIKDGFGKGYFGAFAIRLTGANKPELKEIMDDLNYIRKCSPHKFNTLYNSIVNILGIAEISDITDSIFIKYHINVAQKPEITDKDIEAQKSNNIYLIDF